MSDLPNIVLVHGAWADGSSWSSVIEGLQSKGYDVTAPQFPESSLADDEDHVRIQVLTPIGVLNCAKQLSVVRELTDIAAAACEQLAAARDS